MMTRDPTALRPDDRLERAEREMSLGQFRHLPVVDRHGLLVGLVTQRDLLAIADRERKVSEVMKTDLVTASPETAAHEAAYLLLRGSIGCVPVTDGAGRLIGIVTESDFVRVAYTLLGGQVPLDELVREEEEADRL
jgi:CBS domain-containing protein